MKYTVEYFIEGFDKIPDYKWCTNEYKQGYKKCALGHLQHVLHPDRPLALVELFKSYGYSVVDINDDPFYGDTPKERIMRVLRHIKRKIDMSKELA